MLIEVLLVIVIMVFLVSVAKIPDNVRQYKSKINSFIVGLDVGGFEVGTRVYTEDDVNLTNSCLCYSNDRLEGQSWWHTLEKERDRR